VVIVRGRRLSFPFFLLFNFENQIRRNSISSNLNESLNVRFYYSQKKIKKTDKLLIRVKN